MGTTTRAVLRQRFLEYMSEYISGAATSTGGAAGATLVSTALNAWDSSLNDAFNGQWIGITSGTADGNERKVLDYTTATGTVTPLPVFSAQIASAVTFYLSPYEPSIIHACLNTARELCFPQLYKEAIDEIVSGSPLWNGGFEDYATTNVPDHWASSGTPTLTEETTTIYGLRGSSGLKCTGGSSVYVYQSHVENPGLLDLTQQTVTFHAWVHAAAASAVYLQIATQTQGGTSATTNSSYHSGNSELEHLEVEVAIPEDISDISFRVYSGDGTIYIDNAYLTGVNASRLHLPLQFIHEPHTVYLVQAEGGRDEGADEIGTYSRVMKLSDWTIEDNGTDRFIVFHCHIPEAQRIRLIGKEVLTSVSADTGTMEIETDEVPPLVSMAIAEMFKRLMSAATADTVDKYMALRNYWLGEAKTLLKAHRKADTVQTVKW